MKEQEETKKLALFCFFPLFSKEKLEIQIGFPFCQLGRATP